VPIGQIWRFSSLVFGAVDIQQDGGSVFFENRDESVGATAVELFIALG
jgi:hypothetical protein